MSNRELREKAVFCEALEITDPEQRRLFLDKSCGADAALRAQVERLLALSQGAGDFFDRCRPALEPAAEDADRVLSAAESSGKPDLPESKRIGPYKLLQKLGEGGYGVVYMAEQEEPIRRRVALKIIKLGMDTRNVIARFEAERQALALMDHPNIARVFDAGATETGRPYFVMELVYGVRITEYCDHDCVRMRDRLELFVQVCHAVQHAHQKGIIHRDLKPSNIMVTMHDGVPVPKVIDFGIAKATDQRLTDKTLFTSYAQLMGTPAYMSPEQTELSGLNLDTRSDIYSLGVLLYELLTSRTPFDTNELLKSGVHELRRTLCEREPLSPSAKLRTLTNEELTRTARRRQSEAPRLLSQLRGDLDWIVLKCLEKDRTRRYATANALAMDVERYLHQEAVLARPPSRLYQLQKLVRRNRMVFLLGAIAATSLLVGTIISSVMFLSEREARVSEARLRKQADLRSTVSHIALLVTQRRFEDADELLAGVPIDEPSLEIAAELRALGDWHATQGRWRQAADRFALLIKVDPLDHPEVIAVDQLRLAAAFLQAGDRGSYEQWRQSVAASVTPGVASLPAAAVKALLLLPADPDLVHSLVAASDPATIGRASSGGIRPNSRHGSMSSESLALLEYRRGAYDDIPRISADNLAPPRLAAIALIQAMGAWKRRDYWGAMIEGTRGFALVQAGARQGLVTVTAKSEIFPGMSEPDYLQAAWYDWAFAGLLLREWDEMLAEAERSVGPEPGDAPGLGQIALVRAVGEWHALRGQWSEALRCGRYCVQSNQRDSLDHVAMDYLNAALASLEMGDEKGYLGLREEMIARFKDPDEKTAERTLAVGLMRSIDGRTAALLEPVAAFLERGMASGGNLASYSVLCLLDYRRGDYAKAIACAHRTLVKHGGVAQPNAMARCILAMSLHRLGDRPAARLELEHAKNLIETGFNCSFDMWHWRNWIHVRLLLREADDLLAQAPPSEPGVPPR